MSSAASDANEVNKDRRHRRFWLQCCIPEQARTPAGRSFSYAAGTRASRISFPRASPATGTVITPNPRSSPVARTGYGPLDPRNISSVLTRSTGVSTHKYGGFYPRVKPVGLAAMYSHVRDARLNSAVRRVVGLRPRRFDGSFPARSVPFHRTRIPATTRPLPELKDFFRPTTKSVGLARIPFGYAPGAPWRRRR